MISRDNRVQRRDAYEEFGARRNPYLVDYETQRNGRMDQTRKTTQVRQNGRSAGPDTYRRQTGYAEGERRIVPMKSREDMPRRRSTAGNYQEVPPRRRSTAENYQEVSPRRSNPAPRYQEMPVRRSQETPARRNSAAAKRAAASRRRKRIMMQRLTVSVWLLCILVLAVVLVIRNNRVEAAGSSGAGSALSGEDSGNGAANPLAAGSIVQGLPAEVYASHPEWTEDFLTPNEYSRPGEALETVNNIFVHYTANPGTSAAQNRSYFEQQKDMHEASVSAHFIIGYEGEIIQCVPLDEIAYAVMTRNYDSISIECCYKAQDGSFTQETYDSLISLLAWLTDAYDLDSEDILRHYDCGGKKCPLYYTNHEDEWEQLKKDVDKL